MSNFSTVSTVSPTQTLAGDDASLERDDITVVSTIDFPSRSVTEVHWTPRSRFMRIYNTANFRSAVPFTYVAGDFTDWSSNPSVPQGGTEANIFTKFFDFVILKMKNFVERLAHLTFPPA